MSLHSKTYLANFQDAPALDFNLEYPSTFCNLSTSHIQLGTLDTATNNKRKYKHQWSGTDNEEQYNEVVSQGIKRTYEKDDFYYETNENGFRCDDFDTMDFTKKSIIYLGCSNTFGVGVPEEDSWPTVLHDKIQKEHNTTYNYINLAVGGGGIDWYLHFLPYFGKFNPSLVISGTPEMTRMSMPVAGWGIQHVLKNFVFSTAMEETNSTTPASDITKAYINLVTCGDEYFQYKKQVLLANVNSTAKLLGARFFETHVGRMTNDTRNTTLGEIARDNAHPGRQEHHAFAEYMMNKIKENK